MVDVLFQRPQCKTLMRDPSSIISGAPQGNSKLPHSRDSCTVDKRNRLGLTIGSQRSLCHGTPLGWGSFSHSPRGRLPVDALATFSWVTWREPRKDADSKRILWHDDVGNTNHYPSCSGGLHDAQSLDHSWDRDEHARQSPDRHFRHHDS
jgi:hypothetical protein